MSQESFPKRIEAETRMDVHQLLKEQIARGKQFEGMLGHNEAMLEADLASLSAEQQQGFQEKIKKLSAKYGKAFRTLVAAGAFLVPTAGFAQETPDHLTVLTEEEIAMQVTDQEERDPVTVLTEEEIESQAEELHAQLSGISTLAEAAIEQTQKKPKDLTDLSPQELVNLDAEKVPGLAAQTIENGVKRKLETLQEAFTGKNNQGEEIEGSKQARAALNIAKYIPKIKDIAKIAQQADNLSQELEQAKKDGKQFGEVAEKIFKFVIDLKTLGFGGFAYDYIKSKIPSATKN